MSRTIKESHICSYNRGHDPCAICLEVGEFLYKCEHVYNASKQFVQTVYTDCRAEVIWFTIRLDQKLLNRYFCRHSILTENNTKADTLCKEKAHVEEGSCRSNLVPREPGNEVDVEEHHTECLLNGQLLTNGDFWVCPLLQEVFTGASTFSCLHIVHKDCAIKLIRSGR